ncbi:hypothetical protein HY792_04325 [Candidatus Desantisbacteria bacterium]|nr:hypothetical protein [Candidatus Desantisbacteria bacterium]
MSKTELLELIEKDFPSMGSITEEVRKQVVNESYRYRGSVRISTGRFWTTKEYEENRKRVYSTKLP